MPTKPRLVQFWPLILAAACSSGIAPYKAQSQHSTSTDVESISCLKAVQSQAIPQIVDMRTRFIPIQEFELNKPYKLTFSASLPDTARRYILTLESSQALNQLEVRLNGVVQIFPVHSGRLSDSFAVTDCPQVGQNVLEIRTSQASHLKLFLDGYMDPSLMPNASFIRFSGVRPTSTNAPFVPGILIMKFLEGMRTRTIHSPTELKFNDLNGTNLDRLNLLLKKFGVTEFVQDLSQGKTPDALEEADKLNEAFWGRESSNPNLLYFLKVDEKINLWEMSEQLKQLPYFEDVFPKVPQAPRATSMP